jgi:hypothetical protein
MFPALRSSCGVDWGRARFSDSTSGG